MHALLDTRGETVNGRVLATFDLGSDAENESAAVTELQRIAKLDLEPLAGGDWASKPVHTMWCVVRVPDEDVAVWEDAEAKNALREFRAYVDDQPDVALSEAELADKEPKPAEPLDAPGGWV